MSKRRQIQRICIRFGLSVFIFFLVALNFLMDESGSKVEGKSFGGENEMRRQRREEQNGMMGDSLKDGSLIFADEFNYSGGPDPNMWTQEEGGWGWGNNELQYYTSENRNAQVKDGMLIIESRIENTTMATTTTPSRAYTSARLVSKRAFKYGIFEMRARLPNGRGSWPAFWLLSAKRPVNWPSDGEIDILEHVGYDPGRIHATIHCDKYNHMKHSAKNSNVMISDPFNTFHTYKLDWNAQRLVFYVDDREYFVYTKEKESDEATWPFDRPENIILNTAIGGNWGGSQGVDNSSFPLKYIIDYVRVYSNE